VPPTYRHRVRYHETDQQGFLFNSRYLEIADVAMTEFLRGLGFPYADLVAGGADVSVVRAVVDYLAPARFDDDLDVDTDCVRVGSSSFELVMLMRRGDQLLGRLRLVYVNVDAKSVRSTPLPDEFAGALRTVMVPDDDR
jgi:acyl-CoA thioester hydrolase